ncbi:MAG: ATP-grasp domain-containing protein [Eubacteriales bacterium]|nr:ATP-grasp domain-containing protein [Eubacteriales bacterium]
MNILLTSSGRRTYLVDFFKQALNGEGLVVAANSNMSPALLRADRYEITPLIYSEDYIPFLLDVCRKYEIGLLVPLFDIDLPVLARHRKEFTDIGVVLAVSDEDCIAACNDKFAMFHKLWKAGIRCPETTLSVDDALLKIDTFIMQYPVIVKPRFGMGSLGLFNAEDKAELKVMYKKCERAIAKTYLKYEAASCPEEAVIIQTMQEGDEYGLDVINDFNGRYQTTIVRKKAAMRAGETDEAVVLTRDDDEYQILTKLGEQISAAFGHRGNMDVDVIMGENRLPYVIDMNARFGGGYPFSHMAGINLPKAYIEWAKGNTVNEWKVKKIHAFKDMDIRIYE